MSQHLQPIPEDNAVTTSSEDHTSGTMSTQKELGFESLAVCASPGDFAAQPIRRRRSKIEPHRSLANALQQFAVDNQLALAANLVFLLILTHLCFPSLRHTTSAFFTLSYLTPTGDYASGSRDMYLVSAFVVYFTGIRAFVMDFILVPLSNACGIRKHKPRTRFVEQTYQIFYYSIYWTWGVYLFIRDTPSTVKSVDDLLISLWQGFPVLRQDASMKLYYLTQLAFWIQQVLVLHLEARRKDHYQMLSHHFVTIGLMFFSHGYRQWRVGVAILVLMDVIDLIFSTAKILRYLGQQMACDCAFGLFVVSWLATRHVAYLAVCWSIYAHVNIRVMFHGTYSLITGMKISDNGGDAVMANLLQPLLDPTSETVAFNGRIQTWFLGLLLALHCITVGWFIMIVKVVIRVVRGEGADDSRSDDEGEDEEEVGADDWDVEGEKAWVDKDGVENGTAQPSAPLQSVAELQRPRYIEVETSSEDVDWNSSASASTSANGPTLSRRKSKGISSGLNLGEHKDILNRIGCLSEEQLAREREKRKK